MTLLASSPPPGEGCPIPLGFRGLRRLPSHCVWEITNACNLRCVHCESASGEARPQELTTEEALQVCDDLATLGCQDVNLSGGEPLLRPDWPLLAERLVARGLNPIVVSNLTLLTEDTLGDLERVGVRSVATSVDGPPPVHDRIRLTSCGTFSPFARTLENLRVLKARGLFVSVVTHVSLWNIDHLDTLAHLLEREGVDLWQLQVGFPEGRLAAIADQYLIRPGQLRTLYEFIRRVKRRGAVRLDTADDIGFFAEGELEVRQHQGKPRFWAGCMAGWRVLSISADGTIRGCPSLAIPVGNLRDEPLVDIWRDQDRFWFNTRWDEDKLEGRCRACAFRRICRGGCKSLALSTTGSVYRNIYCLNQVENLGGDPMRREEHGRLLP